MTATRVIEDHKELENSGVVTHNHIDTHVQTTAFIVVSGSANVPASARSLVFGPGVSVIDNGPGSTLVISISSSLAVSWNEVPIEPVDGVNRVFTFLHESIPPTAMMLFLNGQKLKQGNDSDYTLSGSIATFVSSFVPRSGSNIDATYPY